MNKHTRRARETYSQVQGKLRSQKFTAVWQASSSQLGRQRSQKSTDSGVRNLRLWEAAESKLTGGGVRHLRLAESEFHGVADSGVSNLRSGVRNLRLRGRQRSQKSTDSGVRSLWLRGRQRSRKFTESGVRNLRQWQAAESAIDG